MLEQTLFEQVMEELEEIKAEIDRDETYKYHLSPIEDDESSYTFKSCGEIMDNYQWREIDTIF